MKKKKVLLLAFFISLFLLGGLKANKGYADDNGSLQLDPNIITNSNGGVGNTSGFPIVGELFTPTMDQTVKDQMKDNIPEQRKALDFSKKAVNTLYTTDTTKITQQLFVNYKPQVITANRTDTNSQSTLWYGLLSLLGLPLIVLAIFLGRKNAKRSLKKKR
jgi:type VII secretion protein EssA